ncbi:MAG TPA: PIN domain-containing protein [Chthoniobacteraceae bacterium]|nr:PIN domain-containing protein [Chthoniobacteraceae bacterium]
MKWLLDADVLSQPAKRHGDARVIDWLAEEEPDCYTSAVVIGQLALWVRTKKGEQRAVLQKWLRRLIDSLEGKIIGYNVAIAHVWAEQQAALLAAGKRMPLEDSFIAATARRHNLTIVTGNDKDFRGPGLKVFNPFKAPPER